MTSLDNQNLDQVSGDRTVDELIEMTKQTTPACWVGYSGLGLHTSDKSIDALVSLLNINDWTHVRATIDAIGKNKNGLRCEDKLLTFLDNANQFIVTAAIKALSNLLSTRAHDKIKSLTTSGDLVIQQTAIEGLSSIWEFTDFDFFINLYTQTTNEKIRKSIGYVLAEHCNAQNWKMLFNIFSNDSITRHREWAMTIADSFAGDKVLLNLFLNDTDGHIRKKAKELIGALSSL